MPKLNQIIAVEKTAKSQTVKDITRLYHVVQKEGLLTGIARSYRPKDDEGDQLPPESTRVQVVAEDVLTEAATILSRLFDVTATKDWGNTQAVADVVVDGQTLVKDAPVPYLLFLEKQLVDLHTFIDKLPTLDPSEKWDWDEAQGAWAAAPVETTRTKKVLRNHVKAEATPEHPAQVEVYHEDIVVGFWKTIKYSGALPVTRKNRLIRRVRDLQQAVKYAREQANSAQVSHAVTGRPLFDYLLSS